MCYYNNVKNSCTFRCVFGGEECGSEDFILSHIPHGTCFTFNHGYDGRLRQTIRTGTHPLQVYSTHSIFRNVKQWNNEMANTYKTDLGGLVAITQKGNLLYKGNESSSKQYAI